MTVALFIAAWLAIGAMGSFLTLWFWWRDELEITVAEVLIGAGISILGPINLLVGILFFAVWALKRALPHGVFGVVVAERRK